LLRCSTSPQDAFLYMGQGLSDGRVHQQKQAYGDWA
jgi:hypothetical protein